MVGFVVVLILNLGMGSEVTLAPLGNAHFLPLGIGALARFVLEYYLGIRSPSYASSLRD